MYVVLRRYSDHTVIDAVSARQADVEEVLRGVPGFVSYYGVRTGTGAVTVTICQDQAGTTESTRRAAEWVRQNVTVAAGSPPEVTEGEAAINFSA
jgi:hypothetical protein